MLGEVIADVSGSLTGVRVLPTEGATPKLEAALQGSGKLLGKEVTVLATYWQTLRSADVLYGEGNVVFMTDDGGVAKWRGFGVGKPTGPGYSSSWAVCGSFETESASLATLNSIAIASEYDTNENGDWTWVIKEWRSKAS